MENLLAEALRRVVADGSRLVTDREQGSPWRLYLVDRKSVVVVSAEAFMATLAIVIAAVHKREVLAALS
jgi:hypothetical protein